MEKELDLQREQHYEIQGRQFKERMAQECQLSQRGPKKGKSGCGSRRMVTSDIKWR